MEKRERDLKLASQCGPVFMGIAAANFITLNQEDFKQIQNIVTGSSVSILPLWQERERIAALFYRHSFLELFLKKDAVSCLLEELGYVSFGLNSVLPQFERRYREFRAREAVFPHELGLLLGFPPMDVRGYILHQGRDYLLSGYWKVYYDLSYAISRFQEYDAARVSCVGKIMEDASWGEVLSGKIVTEAL